MPCIMYSLCPNVNTLHFRLKIYAGATIIDTPKSVVVIIATENAIKIIARTYASSLDSFIFFSADPFLTLFPPHLFGQLGYYTPIFDQIQHMNLFYTRKERTRTVRSFFMSAYHLTMITAQL